VTDVLSETSSSQRTAGLQHAVQTRGSVVHVVNRFGQRSETFLTDLIVDLDELGWFAWLVSHWPPANGSDLSFPIDERMLRPLRPGLWTSVQGRLSGRSDRARGAEWWRTVLRDVHPELIHVHFGWAAAWAAFERLGIPTVVSFHGSDVRSWPNQAKGNRRAYDELFRELRFATASSSRIADEVVALGFRGRIEVIHPGVHLDRFPFHPPREDSPPRLLFVGRQVECKGLDILLHALRRVIDVLPDVTLVVLGDGPDSAKNRELARSLGLERAVEFRGSQPHSEVARALRGSVALVVPSRTSASGEAEGHPVVPKEAFAAGVPVIATRCGGLRDVFPPSDRPTLVDEGDAQALARAILAFLQHPETWHERATAARAWAEQQFDARRLVDRMCGYYAEIAGGRARR
jgi:colanic acid/amylovoran biosynthesis glycosyltransferase